MIDFAVVGRAAEMALEDLDDDVIIIADAVAVPVARQAGQAVERRKGGRTRPLPRCQIEQHAVDIEDDSGAQPCVTAPCAASFR